MKAGIFHDMDVPPSPHPLISRWPPGLLSAPPRHPLLSLSPTLTMLLLTIKGQSREREISHYFLIQRHSQRVKAWGHAKAEGWGCGRRRVLPLDHSDGCQGGEGTEEVTVQKPVCACCPGRGAQSGTVLIFKLCLPAGSALSFLPGLPWEDRGDICTWQQEGHFLPGMVPRSGWHPWGPGNEV